MLQVAAACADRLRPGHRCFLEQSSPGMICSGNSEVAAMEDKSVWDVLVLAEAKGIKVDLPRDGGLYALEDIRTLKVQSGDDIYLIQARKPDRPEDPVYVKLDDEDVAWVAIMKEVDRSIVEDPDWEPPVEVVHGGHRYRVSDVEARDKDNPGYLLREDDGTVRCWEYASHDGRLVMEYMRKGRGVRTLAGFRTSSEFVSFVTQEGSCA